MSIGHRAAAVAAAGVLALTGCAAQGAPLAAPPTPTASATPASPGSSALPGSSAPPASAGELAATTTVLDRGDQPVLCLGAVGESYPPTCGGPAVEGWDWSAVEGAQTSGGVTWGDFDVVGTWDGRSLTLTRTPVAADPDRVVDAPIALPPADPANAPAVDRALQDYVADADTEEAVLTVGEEAGRVHVGVVFDDGSLQRRADELYGADVVVVDSALAPV